jgi:putative LysE/RhtB family amino acid efflux pump
MGVLCINRTLARGLPVGISTGAGASTVHAGYCAIVLLGMHTAGPWLRHNNSTLSLVGAVLMIFFGLRLLSARRTVGTDGSIPHSSLLMAYFSAITFNAVNPMTLVLLTGSLGAALGTQLLERSEIALVLAGLFCGSIAWWVFLSGATTMARKRLSDRVLMVVNRATAAGLIGFGVLALSRLMFA